AIGLRAARLLSLAGERAVTLLAGKIDAKKLPDENLIKRLIADLDSPGFGTREKAEKEIRALAGQAEPCLRAELRANRSPEVARRIQQLLGAIAVRQVTE